MAFDRSPSHIARILSHSRLFHGMPPASLYDLISHSRIEEIPGDLSQEIEIRPNELRVILEGDFRVANPVSNSAAVLGRGNFFGESAVLDLALAQQLNPARVQSAEGCVCLVISPAELTHWLERHSRLQAAFFQHLSQELFNRSISTSEQEIRKVA